MTTFIRMVEELRALGWPRGQQYSAVCRYWMDRGYEHAAEALLGMTPDEWLMLRLVPNMGPKTIAELTLLAARLRSDTAAAPHCATCACYGVADA